VPEPHEGFLNSPELAIPAITMSRSPRDTLGVGNRVDQARRKPIGQDAVMSSPDHEEVVRRSFGRQVPLFSGPDSPFGRRSTGALSWIEPLAPDMIVLDVACGAAHAAEPVAGLVRQVVGIDLTGALLDVGAQRLRERGITNVLLQEANAEGLPFVDESFDIVYCRSSLHHFADPQRAVAEMLRVCRVGGRIVLVDIVAPSDDVRDQFDRVHRLVDPSHVQSFLEEELAELLPGGVGGLTYANTMCLRLPMDVALTEQSEDAEVLAILRDEMRGDGEPTGFDPAEENKRLVVSFVTSVVHATRR
jgi:SAM-dependent methyltransferase